MFLFTFILGQESELPPAPGFPPFTHVDILIMTLLYGCLLGGLIAYLLHWFKVWITFLMSVLVLIVAVMQIGSSSWAYLVTLPDGTYIGVHSFYGFLSVALGLAGVALWRVMDARRAPVSNEVVTA